MELNEFIENLADQYDDTDAAEFTADCRFRELEEYSSLTAMSIIAMARTDYGKTINGADIRACETVEDLFNMIKNK